MMAMAPKYGRVHTWNSSCVPNPIDELAVCKYCCVHCTCFRGYGHLRYGCVHKKYDRSFYLPAPTFIYGCVHCIATREVLILLGASQVKKYKLCCQVLGFLTSCAVCSYRVIKLEMFWVLSMRLLVKNQILHVFHKMFPEIQHITHLQIISKKYPARARRFITGSTGTHRHIQRTANSKFRMHACMNWADSIGYTANPCIVVYV
jgi:hypothetical protein